MPKDPDVGWHLKYGQYFFEHHQILRDNIFSSEMPNFHYINSAWGTDLLTYLVFQLGGFWGLAILSSIILTLTFYFFSKTARLNLFSETFIFPLVLILEAPLFRNSFRGQTLSFLGISILFYLLARDKNSLILGIKPLKLIPLLFLVWVNLHGEFILGLVFLIAWIFFNIVSDFSIIGKTKHMSVLVNRLKMPVIILISTIFTTLINPFGINIYQETFKHAQNPWQQDVVEWSPVEYQSLFWWYLYSWLFLVGVSSLIAIYKKQLPKYWFYITISFGLLLISFQIRRYIWVTLFVSIPLVKVFFEQVEDLIKQKFIKNILINLTLIAGIIFLILVKIPDLKGTKMDWQTYCVYRLCSAKSAQFLGNYLINNKNTSLLTEYDWGGWLIWNYPGIKPSIDGRMAFWVDQTGYSAFNEYYQLESNQKDVNQSQYGLVYISPTKPVFLRLIKLVEEGKWEIVYKDPLAFIFKRKLPAS